MIPWPRSLCVLAAIVFAVVTQSASGEVPKCGKPDKRILVFQDFIGHPLGNRVNPIRPLKINEKLLPMTISVRITIDREGNVVGVCTLNKNKSSSRTVKLLAEATKAAVSEWKYPKDFGLTGDLHLDFQHAQGIVSFQFLRKDSSSPDAPNAIAEQSSARSET